MVCGLIWVSAGWWSYEERWPEQVVPQAEIATAEFCWDTVSGAVSREQWAPERERWEVVCIGWWLLHLKS